MVMVEFVWTNFRMNVIMAAMLYSVIWHEEAVPWFGAPLIMLFIQDLFWFNVVWPQTLQLWITCAILVQLFNVTASTLRWRSNMTLTWRRQQLQNIWLARRIKNFNNFVLVDNLLFIFGQENKEYQCHYIYITCDDKCRVKLKAVTIVKFWNLFT
jgi:hypothetical protein